MFDANEMSNKEKKFRSITSYSRAMPFTQTNTGRHFASTSQRKKYRKIFIDFTDLQHRYAPPPILLTYHKIIRNSTVINVHP